MCPRHLLAMLLLALGLAGCSPAPDQAAGDLSGDSLMARLDAGDAPLILDVRTPGEYAAGHVPGAVNIPHDSIGGRLADIGADRDREIVVYCQSGRRAAIAETVLAEAGYSRVRHLQGDMAQWQSAGRPVVAEETP